MEDLDKFIGREVFVHRFARGEENFWYGRLEKDPKKGYTIPDPKINHSREAGLVFAGAWPSVNLQSGDIVIAYGQVAVYRN